MPRGDNQVFTMDKVLECLALIKEGASTKSLRLKYGCSKQTILDIRYNRTWKIINR